MNHTQRQLFRLATILSGFIAMALFHFIDLPWLTLTFVLCLSGFAFGTGVAFGVVKQDWLFRK